MRATRRRSMTSVSSSGNTARRASGSGTPISMHTTSWRRCFTALTEGADLRGLTVPRASAPEEMREELDGTQSNWRGLRLEFRASHGPAGSDFHDRFLIFPGGDQGALAWSLMEQCFFPDFVVILSVQCLWRFAPDRLLRAIAEKREIVPAMAVVQAVSSDQALAIGIATENAYVQFAAVHRAVSQRHRNAGRSFSHSRMPWSRPQGRRLANGGKAISALRSPNRSVRGDQILDATDDRSGGGSRRWAFVGIRNSRQGVHGIVIGILMPPGLISASLAKMYPNGSRLGLGRLGQFHFDLEKT